MVLPAPFVPGRTVRSKTRALARAASPGALAEGPDAWFMIDPGGRAIRHAPILSLADDGSDAYEVHARTAESFVLSLSNAVVAGRGVPITAAGEVIAESLLPPDRIAKYHAELDGGRLRFAPERLRDGGGPVALFDRPALLMTGPTDLAFGDWVYNFLPRLQLAAAAGLDVPLLVNADIPSRYVDLLQALGVRREQLLLHDPAGVSVLPRLYVPSWPAPTRLQPMEDWNRVFRRAAVPAPRGPRERLFLSRRNLSKRALLNEAEVRALFVRRGFRIVCPEEESFAQALAAFAQPACVAGPYGSALRNLVFSARPPPALLLMPPDEPGFVQGSALWLAEAGVRFGYVGGRLAPGREGESPRVAPWVVDLDEVAAALDRFLDLVDRGAEPD